jgi:hypothetical protein
MAGDKGFKAAEGVKGDDNMENERGKEWAPTAGPPSEDIKEAGEKSFDPSNAEPTEKGDSASARPAE